MAFSVQMPALGESVTEGTVTRWLKQEGESVEVDEPLLEVSTDKVDTEIPSPAAGVLQKIVVSEDETVEVGAELAVIADSAEGGSSPTTQEAPAAEQPAATQEAPAQEAPAQQAPAAQAEAPEQAPAPAPADQPASNGGTPVVMPALGESVTEGTVTRWLKQVGDHVDVDEPLLEVSTDKVDTEIPSPVAGTVMAITAAEDATVEVGGQLAVIGSGDAAPAQQEQPKPAPQPEAKPERQPAQQPAAQQAAPAQQTQAQPAPAQQAAAAQQPPAQQAPATQAWPTQAQQPQEMTNGSKTSDDAPYVTPLVRKLASENDIDLSSVKGTGVGGRIRKQDVLAAVEERNKAKAAPAPAAAAPARAAAPVAAAPAAGADAGLRGTTQKLSRLRQIVAQRTRESLQQSAQLTQVVEVDVTRVAKLRARAKADFEQREGVKLTFLPFFAKAVVEALKQHPKLNASIDEEAKTVTYHGAEHLGIAIDTERGLLNAVIHDAGDLNLAGLAHKIADLANRARTNKIEPNELSGGTFSLTNLGSNGALFDTPIIQQPQVGILGVGVVVKRPVVVSDEDNDETIAIRSMMYLSLTYDHRLVDGADAGRFLTTVKSRLQEGEFAADLGL
ncbi:MAG TPA: 2-oxoglutarate dehydrogenase, E2 component, dihydrolipoamide succinyltransferase [Pseudonocardiaceae bacterium]|nr:2-oxoglutarate dehydrogenase, E2 component, dihydrolipoamide succinyltransferase [Pseudonocardiaceae bacterium]